MASMWMVSATMRILQGDCASVELAHALGWTAPPSAQVVAAQLMELGRAHATVDQHTTLAQQLGAAHLLNTCLSFNSLRVGEWGVVVCACESEAAHRRSPPCKARRSLTFGC